MCGRGRTVGRRRVAWVCTVALPVCLAVEVWIAAPPRSLRAEPTPHVAVKVPKSGQYGASAIEELLRNAGTDLVVSRSLRDRSFYLSAGQYAPRQLATMLAGAAVGELREVSGVLFVSASPQPGEQLEAVLAADLREAIQAALAQEAASFVSEEFWGRTRCPFSLPEVLGRQSWAAQSLDARKRAWLLSQSGIREGNLDGATVRLRVALGISVVGYPDHGESHTAGAEGCVVH